MNRNLYVGVCLFTLFTSANVYAAPTVSGSETTAADKKLSTSFSFSNSLGLGTFVADDFSDDPYLGQSISVGPSYKLRDDLSASAGWSLGWELTTPNSSVDRRYSPSDVSFSLAYAPKWAKDTRYTGIGASGSFSAILPTSYESRFRHTITNLNAGLKLKRAFLSDKLSLSYGFSFKKYLPSQENPGFLTDPDEQAEIRDDQGNLLVSCSASREVCAGTAGINPNFAISNSFSVSYSWTEKLSTSLSLGISNVFKFAANESFSDPDLLSSGRSDSTSGTVDVSYQINDRFSLSAGVASSQPALDSTNTGIRFPFFDFESASNNFTQFYLSASASL